MRSENPPVRIIARFTGLCLALILVTAAASAMENAEAMADAKMEKGEEFFRCGNFEEAISSWQQAQRGFGRAHLASEEIRALLRQAEAAQALGQHRVAQSALAEADELVEQTPGHPLAAEVKAAQGAASIFARDADRAEPLLRESLKMARAAKDTAVQASTLNDLGIVLSAQGQSREATKALEESSRLARQGGNAELAAKARKNLADAAFGARDFTPAAEAAKQAGNAASLLADGHDKAFLLMGAAQLLQKIFVEAPEHDNTLRTQAFRLDQQAAKVAETIGDRRALSYALGYEGSLYEFEKRYPEALALSRRAVFAAQQAQSPDALYRWEWQTARVLARQNDHEAAIATYRRAVATLQTIRNDVAIRQGNGNAHSSFRQAVGSLYLELTDLLFQRASTQSDKVEIQALLREARDTAELLKAAELDDYFQDDCVNLLKALTKKVEAISTTAAIVYVVPLPNRTEILVSLPSGTMERFEAAISDDVLTDVVRRFRLNLEDRSSDAYLEQAQQLYTWLIKPLESMMTESRLDTMVFVPDGALRTIPMAALHDGKKFLIEKYAVAVSPGLELMEVKPAARVQSRLMISGLSEATEGYPALIHVPQEVEQIEKLYSHHDTLMNQNFRNAAVGERISSQPFTVVHIASHGHFDSDVRKSFVLTFDKHLTLDDLERDIRPAQLRDNPLDLLSLSACQTAAGDDRAALGLAGVAVKAGARSAFATLWFVNDEASTKLVSDFYLQLTTRSDLSKAQALQVAQKNLLVQPRYEHPCYWAPYLIIGNWL